MRIKKFKPCGNCDNGYIHNEDSQGNKIVERCNCWKSYQEEMIITSRLRKSNIPLSILKYDTDQYKGKDRNNNLKAIDNYIKKFNEFQGWHLYFYGPVGTQKSTLLRFICRELLKRNKSVYYILADDLIKDLILADRDEVLQAKYSRIMKEADLLVIDEMSEDKITTYKSGWQRKFILPFLKKRMEIYEKNVIFSSNSPYDNIGEFFEGAIQDLINREVKAQLIFEDNYKAVADSFDISKLWE
ncbi:MAG: ATP-binding protein [Candidatus Woesearchaeota archaeon]|jgi:DNA replication protein DnaC|nr:ATP-binding protein [Candidatus Woesearchaeota archaeon]